MNLRAKLLLLFLMLSVMPLVLMGGVARYVSRRTLEEQFSRSSLQYLNSVRNKVSEYIQGDVSHIQSLAVQLSSEHFSKNRHDLSHVLSHVHIHEENYYYVALVDRDGKIISSNKPSLVGKTMGDRPALLGSAGAELRISRPRFDELAGGNALLIHVPIFSRSNPSRVDSELVASARWSRVIEFVASETINGETQDTMQHIMLTDRDGTVIACFDESEIFNDNLISRGMRSAALAQQGQSGSTTERSEHGLDVFSTYTSLAGAKGSPRLDWLIFMYQDPAKIFAAVNQTRLIFISVMATSLIVLTIAALYISRRMTAPIHELVRATREAGRWNFDNQVKIRSNDELGVLGQAFNQMFQSLKKSALEREMISKQLIQSSKLASIGTLAAGVAHEINNPLAIAHGNLGLLRDELKTKLSAERELRYVEKLEKAISRIEGIVTGLLTFARADVKRVESLDVHSCIEEAIGFISSLVTKNGIELKTDLRSQNHWINGAPGEFQQVILNFITNAKDALQGREVGGLISIETEDSDGKVVIRVVDNGSGIPAAKLGRIFDPFFTTKAPGKGTGLGLSIVSSIVSSMNGSIEVDSKENRGTTFTLVFPAAMARTEAELKVAVTAEDAKISARPSRGRVLIVDDDAEIREILEVYLSGLGFAVEHAGDGKEAFEMIRSGSYSYVVTDIKMPKMSGVQLIEKTRKLLSRDVRFVVITGGMDDEFTAHQLAVIRSEAEGLIKKPFGREEIESLFAAIEAERSA